MAQRYVTKKEKGDPWSVIILLLIFLFFIGIPLMLSKLHKDKENMLSNAKKTSIVGWIFFGLGCFYLLMSLTGNVVAEDGSSIIGGTIMMVVICCGGGYAIVRHAKKYKDMGLKYERYITVAASSPTGSLDDMAAAIGETFDDTSRNIQSLIDAGLLENSYIDQMQRCLVSPIVGSTCQTRRMQSSTNVNTAQPAKAAKPKVKTVKCPNCGGVNNVTEGAGNICEYCGSPLE